MNLNFFEKMQEIFIMIRSSSLFLTIFVIFLTILTFLVIDIKSTKKLKEKFVVFLWSISICYIAYSYYDYFIKLSDNLVEEVFTAIYFPNLAVYTILILSINIMFITKILKKNINIYYKVCNLFPTLIINFLFILIIEIIIKNKINVYEPLDIYSNEQLLVLLQLSSAVYTIWLFSICILKLVFNKIGEPVYEKQKQIINEEVSIYKSDFIYDAPTLNIYEKNKEYINQAIDNTNYTKVFNIEPTIFEKKFIVENLENHLIINNKIKNSEDEKAKYYINNLDDHLYIKNINVVKPIDEYNHKITNSDITYFIDNLDNHLFVKNNNLNIEDEKIKYYVNNLENHLYIVKNDKSETLLCNEKNNNKENFNLEIEDNTRGYKIPLFDTIDDPIMVMLNLNKKPELTIKTKIVKNITLSFEEKLYEKFKNGEELNIDQYKILKLFLSNK